jgi:hypothetical protein
MKTYVITLSQVFPVKHPRKGEPTYFKEKMHNGLLWDKGENVGYALNPSYSIPGDIQLKLHTIRANYALWQKRFEQIESGEACLSIRQWTGKPYASKQVEIARLTNEDGIGLQRLQFIPDGSLANFMTSIDFRLHRMPDSLNLAHQLAKNDGLSFADWKEWFFGSQNYDFRKPLAIIHFTSFRY